MHSIVRGALIELNGDGTGPWVEQWLSPQRFHTYMLLAGGDRTRALDLHEWNTQLNAGLLHDFAHLEVGLRNFYDRALMNAVQPGEAHWTDPASFTALFPAVTGNDARTHADLASARTKAGGPSAPPGKILAELTFGFWVLLTSSRHTTLLWTPHLEALYPAGSQRRKIHNGLDDMRKARNRVAHHEPVRVSDVNNLIRRMRRYAGYVSADLGRYIRQTSTVDALLHSRP
ncbi:CAAX protease [Mycobacterium sp. IS-1590]|nr:CAAX protease [Mycobacterium sp. IS-1590]